MNIPTRTAEQLQLHDLSLAPQEGLPPNGWAVISKLETQPVSADPDKASQLGKTLLVDCLKYTNIRHVGPRFHGNGQAFQLTTDVVGSFSLNDSLTVDQASHLGPTDYFYTFKLRQGTTHEIDLSGIGLSNCTYGMVSYNTEAPRDTPRFADVADVIADRGFGTYLAGGADALPQLLGETFQQRGFTAAKSDILAAWISEICHKI